MNTLPAAPVNVEVVQPSGCLPGTNMTVMFKGGEERLSNAEVRVLTQWVDSWDDLIGNTMVVLGGACETSRTGRQIRLKSLLEMLKSLGISSRRVRHDADWSKPSRAGSLSDLPEDIVWLQVIELPERRRTLRGSTPKKAAMLKEPAIA